MSAFKPVAVYGLNVPSDGDPVEAEEEGRATFRITMAAIDPTAKPRESEDKEEVPPFATLKMIRVPGFFGDDDSDDDEYDDEYDEDDEEVLKLLGGPLGDDDDDDEMDDEDDEEEDEEDDDDEEDEETSKPNGTSKKAKAAFQKLKDAIAGGKGDDDEDEGEDEDEDDDEDSLDIDDDYDEPDVYTICTLDPKKNYQQTLDITINHDEKVFFQVSGAYDITLTGNYLVPSLPADPLDDIYADDSDEYDLSPDEDELDALEDYDDEEDELDDIDDPRIMEVDDDDEAPALIKAQLDGKKGKNKRAAEGSDDEVNGTAALGVDGEAKLSKKQLKKLKKNDGKAVDIEIDAADKPAKGDKKVQFAKELEQGPSPSAKAAINGDKAKPTLGVKNVNGVTIDDKKLGSGPAAKKGNKVSMRYIGKLESTKKVFDSNKKGKPFQFQLGKKEVIQGWEIGVEGMQVGGERRITVPAHLAYGKKGAGADIPPNSTLVFDLKLLEIK